jgi:hypothetical protein
MQGEWVEIEVMHAREWNSAAQKDWNNTKSSNLKLNLK